MKANALLIEDQTKFLVPAEQVLESKWFNVHVAQTLGESLTIVEELLQRKYGEHEQFVTILDTWFPKESWGEVVPQIWRNFLDEYQKRDKGGFFRNHHFWQKLFIAHWDSGDNLNIDDQVNVMFRSWAHTFTARKNERASILGMKVDEILSHEEYFRTS